MRVLRAESKQVDAAREQVVLATLLMYPGLILVDHGHFQYNCVSLGLFIWAVIAIERARLLAASALFVLALNYKQMELYHALPFFAYLLGVCFDRTRVLKVNLSRLIAIGLVTLGTFLLCWTPLLM